jgi:hypothetical protein
MTQRNSREGKYLRGASFSQARLIGFLNRRNGFEFASFAIKSIVTAVNNVAYVTSLARWPRCLRAPP